MSGAIPYGMAVFAGITSLADQANRNKLSRAKLEANQSNAIYSIGMTAQQAKELDNQLAGYLAQNEIEALKAEAFAKAYNSSSGAINKDVALNQQTEMAIKKSSKIYEANTAERNALMKMLYANNQTNSQSDLILAQMATPWQAGLQAASNSFQGFNVGLGMMSQSDRNSFLNNVDKRGKQ